MIQNLFLASLLLLVLFGNSSKLIAEVLPENRSCSSIASLDLENTIVNDVKFVDGEACTSDDAELPNQCDWAHTITKDEILRPIPGKEVRLVIINSNHETGSGAWDTILVFDCLNGALRKIFENKYHYGVKVEKIADGEFLLSSGAWQPKDPMCCPSKEKHETYRWHPTKSTYILESTTTSTLKPK